MAVFGQEHSGGQLEGTPLTVNTANGPVPYIGLPFITSKGYLPDVLSWAAGAEVALGNRNTLVADLLANQVGLINGIYNTTAQTLTDLSLPTGPNGNKGATPTTASITGLVSAGQVTYGQYSASLGYKARIAGNLVANLNVLIRLDNNGLTARIVPLFGLGYSF